jgi:hypothetical protein
MIPAAERRIDPLRFHPPAIAPPERPPNIIGTRTAGPTRETQAMTPQERQLVDELFDRLAQLENAPRDGDAERAIADGLRRAPHAVYALVQTALVQDEALKRANARIQELEGGSPQDHEPRGFLDTMRDSLFGREERRGSVPTVRPGGQGASGVWGSGQDGPPPPPAGYGSYGPGPAPFGGGGSFLGTAAASAAGVIGGAMLLNGIRSMFGHSYGGSAAYDPGPSTGSPWGGGSAANSDLARQAGIDDIGTSRSASGGGDTGRAGLFGGDDQDDTTDTAYDDSNDDDMDVAGDFGGGDTDSA